MNSTSTLFDIIAGGRANGRSSSRAEDHSTGLSIEELAMVHGGSGGASGGANGTGHGGTRRNEQQPNLPGNATPYDGGSSVDLSSHGGGSGPGYQGTEAHWESPIFSDPMPTYPNPFPTGY